MITEIRSEPLQLISRLIEGVMFSALTTSDDDGSLHSRPMVVLQPTFEGDLYFIASRSSRLVANIRHHSLVNVSFDHQSRQTYVSMSGIASVVDDPQRVKNIWRPLFNSWFTYGATDPDVALIHVVINHADTWEPLGHPLIHPPGEQPAWVEGGSPTHSLHRRINL